MTPTQSHTRHPALTSAILNAACIDAAAGNHREYRKLKVLRSTGGGPARDAYWDAFWQASGCWHNARQTRREHRR